MGLYRKKPEFDFTNARSLELRDETIEPDYYEARVTGTFFNEMAFYNFPFDDLFLHVEIEPGRETGDVNEVSFVLDPESKIETTAKIPGWAVEEYEIMVQDYVYDEADTYSRFIASFNVERSITGSFVKFIFPVAMITGLSVMIFFIPENFTPRIYLTAPLLLSLVYLHQGALDEIPPIGYMTIFDKVMVINYSIFINAIGSLAIQMRMHYQKKDQKEIKKVNDTMRLFIPVIIVVGLIVAMIPPAQ